ncbi:tenascin-X isoform X3 [Xenopus laevis]|uniref:Tenascin-X isoform X3 n=1 Tax=Xenopus laevis TaxID=8355 RepID=A0A8J1LIB1_XENLA|nr:tenascin-X isoform X3 [Xenopus laevis]
MGEHCQLKTCPEDCNDQGRCKDGQCVCFPGYFGIDCGSKSCPNNCQNHGRCEKGVCICDSGYSGVDCSSRTCPKNCFNRGRCKNGVCICDPDYTGLDCSMKTCLNDCQDHGRCEDGMCVCYPGFTGVDCSSRTCLNDCQNNGRCEDGVCVCDSGFSGPDCGFMSCPEDCNEQGRCVSGVCICDSGFIGPDCGTRVCSPECERRGRCEDGECICNPGFTGPDCEIKTCPNDCHKQGMCVDGKCVCDSEYTGLDCQFKSCPNKCHNRGRCEDGICICNSGYSGSDCGSKTCPKNCSGNGQCVKGKCICDPGFIGPVCGTRACSAGCSNHGRCVRGICVCSPGYTGVDCASRLCPKNCNNRGRCENGVCICDPEYTGLDCGSRNCPNNCNSKGQCDDGVCICDLGYTGLDCATKSCFNDCHHRGRCVDGVCICEAGYTGLDCGTLSCPEDCHNRGQCENGVCVCDPGFTGLDCGSRSCPNNCNYRGQCEDGECICDSGYTDHDCGSKTCPNNCQNHGRCDNGECICDSGYAGTDCGLRPCPNNCHNQGQCVDGVCICNSGYTDLDCGLKTCPYDCHDRGQCVNGICICDSGYSGLDCGSASCPNNCQNHGKCDNGECVCDSGYTGVDCGTQACPENCHIHGRCEQGVCICQPGYTGLDCSSKSCPKNCNGNGQCINGKCNCDFGFAGPVCGSRTCPGNCGGRGKCINGVCMCKKGYEGADCSMVVTELVAVTGLHVTSVEESSVTIEWDLPQTPPDLYVISFKAKKENGLLNNTVDGSLTSFVQTGLASGEEYLVSIQPQKGLSVGPDTTVTATTSIETPQGLRVTEITTTSFLLRWERPQSFPDRYIVTLVSPSGKEKKLKAPGKGDRVRVTGLEEGTIYKVILRAERGQEQSRGMETTANTAQRSTKLPTVVTTQPTISQKEDIITTTTLSVSPRPRVPAQMGALQVRNVTSESITLVWKAKIRVYDSFLVRYEEVTEGVSPQEISVPGDQREVTLRGLTQDTRYAVLLYGIKGGKLSRPLREEVTTEPLPDRGTPPRLSPLLVSEVHTNSALLSWEPLDGDFDAYILRYGPPEGPMQEETLRGDQTSFLIDGLVAGVNYSVELLGIWGESYTEPQVTNVLTEKPQPPRLESLTLSDVRSESLHLSWDVQGGEFDSFLLLYRDGEGKPQEITLDKNLRSFTIIDLKPGKKYKFVLYGMSGEKRSKPVSAEGSTEKLQPPRLESLSVSDVHSDSVLLSWVVQGGKFDSFLLNYRDAEGKPKEVAFEGEQRSVPVGELKPGKKYKFILYGISGGKKSKAVIAEATTKPLPEKGTLPRLSPLLVSEVHTNSALLSWQALDGNFDAYILRYGPPGGPMQEETLRGDQTSFLIDELVAAVNYSVELLGIWGERYTAPQVTSVLTEPLPEKGTLPRLSPLLVSEVHTNSALLSWQALDGNFDAYILRYGPPGGPMQEETLRGDQTSFLIDELVAAVNYSVELLGIWGERYTAPQVTSVLTEKRQPPRLEYLTLSDVRSESLHLSWDVQGGEFDSFLLLYRDGEGKPQEKTVDKELRAFTVRDLKPGKKYKFVLYGMSGEKRSKPVSAEGGTEKLQPPQLESLSVSDVHSHSVLLSWVVQGGKFDSFLLNYRDAEGKPKEVALEGEQRSVPVGELKPGKKYKFVLYGISGGKKSKAAIAETTTKPHEKLVPSSPATPTMPRLIDLQANEIGKDSVNLSWKVEGESSFDWIVVQYGEPDGRVREEQVPGGDTSTTVTGLLPSRRYKFNLYGIKGERRSKPLSIEIETDFLEAIGQPTSFLNDLYVSPRGPHSILLSWEAPEGFDSFVINYSIEGHEKPQKKASVDGTARTLLLTDLQPDTLYKVILHGIRKGKEQNSLKATGRTGSLDLEPPKNLRFNDVEETSFTVIWDPPNPETTTFKVSYQLAKGGEPESVSVVGDSKSLQRLNSGTHYEVTVVSVRGFEESQPLTGYITTGGGGPRSLRALDVTEESALLRWEPEMGSVDRYLVTYRAENVLSVTLEVSSDQTELPITGLNPHTEYYASVQSLHGSKLSSPTSTSFTTGADTPRELLANKITAHSALLTWKPPQAVPDAYRLIYQTQDGEMKEFILPANMSSFTLSHLTPSTPYKVQLHALRGASSSAPISTSFTTGRIRFPFPQNCWEKLMNGEVQSGLFTIYMGGSKDDPLLVYCDMETDGGGWIVFQRRMDGKTNFWRDWNEYKMGFGNFTSEFWLGNTALHRLSSLAPYELRVDLRAGAESAHAVYEDFRIEPEDKHFRLRIGEYRGTAGDSLSYHNNMIFSTRDRDAQKRILPCAISYRGAWWYKNCHYANLNGIYGNNKDHQGMNWYTWKGFEFSIPFTEMKMRPQRAGNWRRL